MMEVITVTRKNIEMSYSREDTGYCVCRFEFEAMATSNNPYRQCVITFFDVDRNPISKFELVIPFSNGRASYFNAITLPAEAIDFSVTWHDASIAISGKDSTAKHSELWG